MEIKTLIAELISNDIIEQQMLFQWWIQSGGNEDELIPFALTVNVPHIRIHDYYEEWIPQYLDVDFFCLFRMTKETFVTLLNALNCEKALLMTLWWLGKQEVLLSIADRFNVTVSTVHKLTEFMLEKIIALRNAYITWPDAVEVRKIKNDFQNRCGYPEVIGAIDVCNILFKAPLDQQNSYIDKNRRHSIKLQGIVTNNKIFTDVMAGYPGSAHDSRVFRNSQIYTNIQEHGLLENYFYGNNYHILGDKAYQLETWILTPFRDNGHLTPVQRYYNSCHSRARIVVEHTFGLLKSRWRILQFINVHSVVKAVQIIMACCVLHNFCYINSDFWNNYEPVLQDDEHNIGENIPSAAAEKRRNLAEILWEQQ